MKSLCLMLVFPSAMACAPADLKGTGTPAVLEFNLKGAAAGTWCPGEPNPRRWAITWAKLASNPKIAWSIGELRFAANPANAIVVLEREFTDTPISDLRAVWEPMEIRLQASRPKPEVWRVAPAMSNANPPGTRPTYAYTAPALIRLDGGRIAHGELCDCTLARYASPQVYCSVQGLATKVAVCLRQ